MSTACPSKLILGLEAFITVALMAAGPALADTKHIATSASAPISAATPQTITLSTNDQIAVTIESDVGSRISQEGATFGVVTAEDYSVNGQLVLPKGSPGYGCS
jgi:hypothetical protein